MFFVQNIPYKSANTNSQAKIFTIGFSYYSFYLSGATFTNSE